MKLRLLLLIAILFCTSPLVYSQAPLGKMLSKAYPELDAAKPQIVIIYLKDKVSAPKSLSKARSILSERSIRRRLKVRGVAGVIDQSDLPLTRSYVAGVAENVVSVRHELKWFNAVTAMATKAQIEKLRALPFVTQVDLVGRWRTNPSKEAPSPDKSEGARAPQGTTSLDYGTSWSQLHQMNVPAVHDLGIYGQGIVVGVFDNGFRLPGHHAFDSMNIAATYDFVDHKVSVVPNNTSTGFGSHGINTLSTVGGNAPGLLYGPAFKATFLLARTENDSSETPIEEDNWAKAAEWADSIGVDVTSTSLGYLTYDAPYTSWTSADLDGNTTLITRAADRAAELGIVVVNSASNSGPGAQTLGAPADGDSVITAGAVDSLGNVASFSSRGPTADGRIKPDIMAMGIAVKAASSTNISNYVRVSGTSFSCPLSAGVAALILCANPSLTPMQVRDAMRNTASRAGAPGNTYGWGIVNAYAAVASVITTSHISGAAFTDINGDGIRQGNEPAAAGVTIHITGAKDSILTTDATGSFRLDSLADGEYAFSASQPGMLVIAPATPFQVDLDSANRIVTGLLFAIAAPGAIHGTIFNDANWSHTLDAGDTLLSGWRVELSGPATITTLTDSLGNYSFTGLAPGSYAVAESLPSGWSRTLPESPSYSIQIVSGLDTGEVSFGNIMLSGNSYQMSAHWNLFSLPLKTASGVKSELFPSAISNAFFFNGTQYLVADTLVNRVGYWLKYDSSQIVSVTGVSRTTDTFQVQAGWNLVGILSVPAPLAGMVQIPDSNLVSSFYGYDHGYIGETQTLQPWKGYWVKAKVPGVFVLSAAPGILPSKVSVGTKNRIK